MKELTVIVIGMLIVGVLMSGCIEQNGGEDKNVTDGNETNVTSNESVTTPQEEEEERENVSEEKENVSEPKEEEAPQGFDIYADEKNGFKIAYPSDWIKEMHGGMPTFMSPSYGSANELGTSRSGKCYIVVEETSMALSQYKESKIASIKTRDSIIIDDKDMKFCGLDGGQIIYTYLAGSIDVVKESLTYTIKDGKGYTITCGGIGDTYPRHKSNFDEIIGSFEFI